MCSGFTRIPFICAIIGVVESTILWEEWWTYEGISGPAYWGARNKKDWALCSEGKYQSPIDVDPQRLIFDPNLTTLKYDSTKIGGQLMNTRRDITLEIFKEPTDPHFVFTGGPLSYRYRATQIKLHFGTTDDRGSEHMIAGRRFPLEVQIIGYNEDLYKNFTQAIQSTHGIAIISILGVIDNTINLEFDKIIALGKFIKYMGFTKDIHDFSIMGIIPPSEYYLTYEGSTTYPGCEETVTWLIINKPLHITKDQMSSLRDLNRWNAENTTHLYPLEENNFRPVQSLHRRPIRTNISPYKENEECAVKLNKSYKGREQALNQSNRQQELDLLQMSQDLEKRPL